MRRRRHPESLVFLLVAVAALIVWVGLIASFDRGPRPPDVYVFWDGSAAAVVFGMAIVGSLAALVVGGLIGLTWPWRVLGIAALLPFVVMVTLFSALSAAGVGCPDMGGACSVSVFQRFGGLLVTLACCATAWLTSRWVLRQQGR